MASPIHRLGLLRNFAGAIGFIGSIRRPSRGVEAKASVTQPANRLAKMLEGRTNLPRVASTTKAPPSRPVSRFAPTPTRKRA